MDKREDYPQAVTRNKKLRQQPDQPSKSPHSPESSDSTKTIRGTTKSRMEAKWGSWTSSLSWSSQASSSTDWKGSQTWWASRKWDDHQFLLFFWTRFSPAGNGDYGGVNSTLTSHVFTRASFSRAWAQGLVKVQAHIAAFLVRVILRRILTALACHVPRIT